MESVLRAAAIYGILLIIMRISGKRSLAQITTFDFVLLLIVGEAVQNVLIGQDFSLINAAIVISTLLGLDIFMSLVKQRSRRAELLLDGTPLVLMHDGELLWDRMNKERIDPSDILAAARNAHGLERLDQIKYAVLEKSGGISIIPKAGATP